MRASITCTISQKNSKPIADIAQTCNCTSKSIQMQLSPCRITQTFYFDDPQNFNLFKETIELALVNDLQINQISMDIP